MATTRTHKVMCPARVACDGTEMYPPRAMCYRCEEAVRRRERQERAAAKIKASMRELE